MEEQMQQLGKQIKVDRARAAASTLRDTFDVFNRTIREAVSTNGDIKKDLLVGFVAGAAIICDEAASAFYEVLELVDERCQPQAPPARPRKRRR